MNNHYQRLIQILKPNSREIGQVYSLAIFKGIVALSLPLGIQSIINFIQGGSVSSSWIVLSVLITIAVGFNGYLQILQMRTMENIQQHLFVRSAFDVTARLPRFKTEGIRKYYAPELMNRFFEVLTIQKSLSKIIIELSTAFMQILLGLILLCLYHYFFVIFSISLILFMILVIRFTASRAMESSLSESKYKYKVVSWLEELARSRHSFKLAGKTDLPQQRTDDHVSGYLESREKHYRILNVQYKWLLIFKISVTLFLLLAGGVLVINQQMNIGQFVAAEIIIMMMIEAAEKLILNLENFYDIFTSAIKLEQITKIPVDDESQKPENLTHDFHQPASVDIIDLDFSFADDPKKYFNKLNFRFEKGKKYFITGPGGSGKSTLLHLISGLIVPDTGNICINEIPVANYKFEDLYKIIGNCFKEESLFEGTILENITLGRPHVTMNDVQVIASRLHLSEYIKTLPGGFMTNMQPQGTNIPSSVIQKILLARALVINPKLILMEQSLDSIPEHERLDIMKWLCDSNDWTMIITSSQDYLRKNCDHVLEISEGGLKMIKN